MKTMLAIMIVLLLLVGIAAFALAAIGAPLAPDQPLPLGITESGAANMPHIACSVGPCDCEGC